MVEIAERIRDLIGRYTTKEFSVVTEGHPHIAKCRPFPWMGHYCQAGKKLAHINLDQDVLPCPAFKQKPEYFAGNLKTNSIEDIWNNSAIFRELRTLTNDKLDEPCKTCPKWKICYGACAAQRCWTKESIYASPDPVCVCGK